MPTIRQSLVAAITRRYPLYSGCGTLANSSLIRVLAGPGDGERVWTRVRGGEVEADLSQFIGRAAYYVGDLDRKITWICSRLVRPGDTVLDIGANIGLVTLWLSELTGTLGRVYAFEPNPHLYDVLLRTVRHNRRANVALQPVALGERRGKLRLRVPQSDSGKGSLVRHADESACAEFDVPVITLSDFIVEEGIKSIRFMKIDVEGFEADVLKGADGVLTSVRPEAILFEMNDWQTRPDIAVHPVFEILAAHAYGFFRVPKCLFSMHVDRFVPGTMSAQGTNDFIAVPIGPLFDQMAARLVARS